MKNININLSFKLIIVVIIGVVMVFSLFGFIRMHVEKNNLKAQMDRSGQERTTLIAESLANLIVAYDYSNIESLASRIVKMQDVQQINVLNRNGKVMVSRKSDDFNAELKGLVFVSPVIFSDEVIGKVELLVSLERYEESIRNIYRNVIVAVIFSMIFFVVLIYATVSRFIVRPLSRLSKAAEQLAIGNYAAELPPVTRDEMGVLVRTFSSMRESRELNEARLKTVFDHSPDAFIQLGSEGNITDWNEKAESIWGYAKNEVLGKNFSIVMPDSKLGLNPDYRQCYQKSENIIGVIREVTGQRKDGRLFPLELRTSEILFEEGSAYLVLARDITERKENEIKLLNAMNAAEAANAAKSAFLSNMSHEIRTPMNSIIGMTKLALKTHLNARQHDYLNKIDYSANHLLGLINNVLDFSKIEASKLELEEMDFELSSLFENLSNQLVHSAESKGLHLEFDLDPGLFIPLRGDLMRLSQVLLNYTSNAIKFADKGDVSISGKLLDDGPKDVLIRFEVHDNGIGLSKIEMDNLFQPFHQADASTTRKYGGTGLGLAICKQLVELMDGNVGVESQPGQGSTFWFIVRLRKGENPKTSINDESLPDMKLLKGASILLVEDNTFNQQVGVELLQGAGASVSIANNGQEGINILQAQRFDCVLMDIQMPVMDGLEATRRIRDNPDLADIRIIAMTANAGREDRERCFAAGMNYFISKPVFAENLYSVIVQCLSDTQSDNIAERSSVLTADTDPVFNAVSLTSSSPSSNNGHSAAVDLSVLRKMLGSDSSKVHKFARKYLQSARKGLDEIEAALRDEDMKLLASLGHRNKSPARTVGAFSYAELCQSLERFKDGGDVAHAHSIVAMMHLSLEQISTTINDEISSQ